MEEYLESLKDILTEHGSVTVSFVSSKLGLDVDKSKELFLSFVEKNKGFSLLYTVQYNLEGNNLQMDLVSYDELQDLSSKHESLRSSVYALVNNKYDSDTVSRQLYESLFNLSQEEMLRSQQTNSLYIPSFVNLRISNIKVRNFQQSRPSEPHVKKQEVKREVKMEFKKEEPSVTVKKEQPKKVDVMKEVKKKSTSRILDDDDMDEPKVKKESELFKEDEDDDQEMKQVEKNNEREQNRSQGKVQDQVNEVEMKMDIPTDSVDEVKKSELFDESETLDDDNKQTKEPPEKKLKVSSSKKKEKRSKTKSEDKKSKKKEEVNEVPEVEMDETLFEDDVNDGQEHDDEQRQEGTEGHVVNYYKKSEEPKSIKFIEKVSKEKTYVQNGYYVVEESEDYVEVVKENTKKEYKSETSSSSPKNDLSSDKSKTSFSEKNVVEKKSTSTNKKMNQSSIMSFFKK